MPKVEFPDFLFRNIEICSEEPQREKVFFYVYQPEGWKPNVQHTSFQSAKHEAQRIARKTWKETFILQAIKSYKVNDLLETNFMHEPEKRAKKRQWALKRQSWKCYYKNRILMFLEKTEFKKKAKTFDHIAYRKKWYAENRERIFAKQKKQK